MKKFILLLTALLSLSIIKGQGGCIWPGSYLSYLENCNADTTNLYLPDVFNDTCFHYYLPLNCGDNSNIPIDDSLFAIAQPYHTDTAIHIDGIVFYNRYSHHCSDTSSPYADYYYCDPQTLYCEILDGNLNPIYHIRYDTINQNVPESTIKHFSSTTFYSLNFDSIITVQGNFYVTISLGSGYTPDSTNNPVSLGKLVEIPTKDVSCREEGKRNYPLLQFNNDTVWYNMENVNSYKFAAFPIYPRLNTTGYIAGSSDINNINQEEFDFDVFPNPTNSEVNINCGYKIKTLQVYDEQGKVLLEKEVNAYNYQINLNTLPQGTYFIKVITNSGQATKKVIKE